MAQTANASLPDTTVERTPRRKAFLVDVSAAGPRKGIPALAPLLRDRGGFEIRALDTPNATRTAILEGLAWLAEGAARGDTLFFIYEGPGADPPVLPEIREVEGYVQRLVPIDCPEAGHLDHQDIYRTLIQPLPAGVRVLVITDTCHDGSLLELKNVVALQAVRPRGSPALPHRVEDREYDNREWDVAVHLRRRGVYREPAAEVVAIAPGLIDADFVGQQCLGRAVASAARAVERACESPEGGILRSPLISICKHAAAELRIAGAPPDRGLLMSTTGPPLTALICTLA